MRQVLSPRAVKSFNITQADPIPCHLISTPLKVDHIVDARRASWEVLIFEVVGRLLPDERAN